MDVAKAHSVACFCTPAVGIGSMPSWLEAYAWPGAFDYELPSSILLIDKAGAYLVLVGEARGRRISAVQRHRRDRHEGQA